MKLAVLLVALAGCPTSNPPQLWLAGDPANELVIYLQDHEPIPY